MMVEKAADITDLELVEGRLEGLKILLDTPANEKTMTDAELKFAIQEVETIRDCMKITEAQPRETAPEQKTMTVGELIEHLKGLKQDLPVYYVMFDDGYNVISLTQNDIVVSSLEDGSGKEFECVTLGEGWLL